MKFLRKSTIRDLSAQILRSFIGPPVLAFLPAATLSAFWFAGETGLLIASLGLPLIMATLGILARNDKDRLRYDTVTGLLLRDGFSIALNDIHADCAAQGQQSACFVLQLDDFTDLANTHGQGAADVVALRSAERITQTLRDTDVVARLSDSRIAVALHPVRHMDLELALQLSGRLQMAVEAPTSIDGIAVYTSCSIGFCLSDRVAGNSGTDWLNAATTALIETEASGPSAIRAFSTQMQKRSRTRHALREDAATALSGGQILPWFQPQISTDTGKLTGFEALARWSHPVHGMIAPNTFLPVLEDMGLLDRLGEVVLYHCLTALKAWDSAGITVPCVGVNFPDVELRNPNLADRIGWDLDRFELTPDRLAVEILETVVSNSPEDAVVHSINALRNLGCRIDLDDFGTGHASIAAIQRFGVGRIKIDRSFVTKADQNSEQHRMVAAILTMAERLGLETLAEGVETVGEHALLAQLGCNHVQGFGIARPMPFEQTLDWVTAHNNKLEDPPRIGGKPA